MELKPKYQYTYFIKPFYIEEEKYDSYLTNILKNERFSLKIWEQEKDLDIYSYFLPEIRDKIFATFQYSKEKIAKLAPQYKIFTNIPSDEESATVYHINSWKILNKA